MQHVCRLRTTEPAGLAGWLSAAERSRGALTVVVVGGVAPQSIEQTDSSPHALHVGALREMTPPLCRSRAPLRENRSARTMEGLGWHQQLKCGHNINTFPVALCVRGGCAYFLFLALSVFAAASSLCAPLCSSAVLSCSHGPTFHYRELSRVVSTERLLHRTHSHRRLRRRRSSLCSTVPPQPWLSVAHRTTATTRHRPTTER
jgi:hypothetical protein